MKYKNIWFLLYSITFSFIAGFNNDLVCYILSFVSFLCYIYFAHWNITHNSWKEWVYTDFDNHTLDANELIGKYFRGE